MVRDAQCVYTTVSSIAGLLQRFLSDPDPDSLLDLLQQHDPRDLARHATIQRTTDLVIREMRQLAEEQRQTERRAAWARLADQVETAVPSLFDSAAAQAMSAVAFSRVPD